MFEKEYSRAGESVIREYHKITLNDFLLLKPKEKGNGFVIVINEFIEALPLALSRAQEFRMMLWLLRDQIGFRKKFVPWRPLILKNKWNVTSIQNITNAKDSLLRKNMIFYDDKSKSIALNPAIDQWNLKPFQREALEVYILDKIKDKILDDSEKSSDYAREILDKKL